MKVIEKKFERLGIESAPGQEVLTEAMPVALRGEKLAGTAVDFSHGDVDALRENAQKHWHWLTHQL